MITVTGGSDEGDEGEAVMEGGGQGRSPGGAPTSLNQPGKPNHKPISLSRKRPRAMANKPQDFQVLFKFCLLCPWIITNASLESKSYC